MDEIVVRTALPGMDIELRRGCAEDGSDVVGFIVRSAPQAGGLRGPSPADLVGMWAPLAAAPALWWLAAWQAALGPWLSVPPPRRDG